MRLGTRLAHMPARMATGAFILNSGLAKRGADEQTAQHLHGMAKGTYPFLGRLDSRMFVKVLSAAEIAVGTALLLPVIPTAVAGAALVGFSGGLMGLYLKTPGMRQEGSLKPTMEGIGLSKDVWMLGIGLTFVVESVVEGLSGK